MTMENEYSMIITTCPDKNAAKKIAKLLIEKRLAACVQMFPVESLYVWKGQICDESEIALFIKSKTSLFDSIKSTIKANHKYELPEIIQIPITDGLPEYLKWIGDCTEHE